MRRTTAAEETERARKLRVWQLRGQPPPSREKPRSRWEAKVLAAHEAGTLVLGTPPGGKP